MTELDSMILTWAKYQDFKFPELSEAGKAVLERLARRGVVTMVFPGNGNGLTPPIDYKNVGDNTFALFLIQLQAAAVNEGCPKKGIEELADYLRANPDLVWLEDDIATFGVHKFHIEVNLNTIHLPVNITRKFGFPRWNDAIPRP